MIRGLSKYVVSCLKSDGCFFALYSISFVKHISFLLDLRKSNQIIAHLLQKVFNAVAVFIVLFVFFFCCVLQGEIGDKGGRGQKGNKGVFGPKGDKGFEVSRPPTLVSFIHSCVRNIHYASV